MFAYFARDAIGLNRSIDTIVDRDLILTLAEHFLRAVVVGLHLTMHRAIGLTD